MTESSLSQKLYLDDLTLGQKFISATYVIEEAEIIEFASKYDPQPFHTDREAAKTSFFGGLAASGWLTASVTMRLLVDGGLPIAGGLIGAGCELSWTLPVRPGDTLSVESEVVEIVPSRNKPRGTITVRSTTFNQDKKVVQLFTSRVIVSKR
jgi:acyl dehydratase